MRYIGKGTVLGLTLAWTLACGAGTTEPVATAPAATPAPPHRATPAPSEAAAVKVEPVRPNHRIPAGKTGCECTAGAEAPVYVAIAGGKTWMGIDGADRPLTVVNNRMGEQPPRLTYGSADGYTVEEVLESETKTQVTVSGPGQASPWVGTLTCACSGD